MRRGLPIALLVASFTQLALADEECNPEQYIQAPWRILRTGATFIGCTAGGSVTLNWNSHKSWMRVTSTANGATQTTVLPSMWYTQSSQTTSWQQTYWYATHSKGEIWFYSRSLQCLHPTVPPFISGSTPQVSQTFLYDDIWDYACEHDCTEDVGAGE